MYNKKGTLSRKLPHPNPPPGLRTKAIQSGGFGYNLKLEGALKNENFRSRSRHAKNLTAGICLIFRGLNFEHNADIGRKGLFSRCPNGFPGVEGPAPHAGVPPPDKPSAC